MHCRHSVGGDVGMDVEIRWLTGVVGVVSVCGELRESGREFVMSVVLGEVCVMLTGV